MLVLAAGIVVASLAAALVVMESPAKQRDRRLDERRLQELQAISEAIDEAATRTARMPRSLAELAGAPGASLAIVDPVDGSPYGFRATAPTRYRLCASFATSTSDRDPDARRYEYFRREWPHPAGLHCFDRQLDAAARAAMAAARKAAR
jgi:hypothetical protein